MTPDQIRAMPAGPELDQLAAIVVLGHKPSCVGIINGVCRIDESGDDDPGCSFSRKFVATTEGNIAHAWELVEVLQGFVRIMRPMGGREWEVIIATRDRNAWDEAAAESVPLAITRAAILAKMGER